MEQLAGTLAFWVMWAVVAAWIGHRKGRRFWAWFGIGLLLGVFGFLIALFTPTDQAGLDQRKLNAGLRKCPACLSWVSADASVCRFCRAPATPLLVTRAAELG